MLYTPFNGELIEIRHLIPGAFSSRFAANRVPGTAMDLFSGEEFWMLPVAGGGGSLGQAEIWGAFPKSGKGLKGAALGMHCEYIMGHNWECFLEHHGKIFGGLLDIFLDISGY